MAAYPAYGQMVGSESQTIDDITVDRARGGGAKVRSLYSTRKSRFQVVHRLDPSEVSALMSFYSTNRLLAVDLTWDADSGVYSCVFAGPPQVKYDTPQWAEVVVVLEEV